MARRSVACRNGGKKLLELAATASVNAVIVTNASLPGGLAVYAAERITGYPVDEILGRNPRILQGPYSDGKWEASS